MIAMLVWYSMVTDFSPACHLLKYSCAFVVQYLFSNLQAHVENVSQALNTLNSVFPFDTRSSSFLYMVPAKLLTWDWTQKNKWNSRYTSTGLLSSNKVYISSGLKYMCIPWSLRIHRRYEACVLTSTRSRSSPNTTGLCCFHSSDIWTSAMAPNSPIGLTSPNWKRRLSAGLGWAHGYRWVYGSAAGSAPSSCRLRSSLCKNLINRRVSLRLIIIKLWRHYINTYRLTEGWKCTSLYFLQGLQKQSRPILCSSKQTNCCKWNFCSHRLCTWDKCAMPPFRWRLLRTGLRKIEPT